MSIEFNSKSGRHQNLDLNTDRHKIKPNKLKIIDNSVFDKNNQNVALSKNSFADYIYNQSKNFNDFDFRPFNEVFEIIDKILRYHYNQQNN